MAEIIGVMGHAGVGKDTAAAYFVQNHQFTQLSFADPLKRACAEAFGIPLDYFYDQGLKNVQHAPWGKSAREIAQYVGTEMFREGVRPLLPHIGNDFWIDRARLEISKLGAGARIVISDVRFQNEVDFIGELRGKLIYLKRRGKRGDVGIKGHASEQLDRLKVPRSAAVFPINNDGTFEELYACLEEIV